MQALRREAGRRVLGVLLIGRPLGAARHEARVAHALAACLDDEKTAAAGRVLRLVPLRLVVAHEAVLVGPVRRIGRAVLVELVGPDLSPLRLGRHGGNSPRRHGEQGEEEQRHGDTEIRHGATENTEDITKGSRESRRTRSGGDRRCAEVDDASCVSRNRTGGSAKFERRGRRRIVGRPGRRREGVSLNFARTEGGFEPQLRGGAAAMHARPACRQVRRRDTPRGDLVRRTPPRAARTAASRSRRTGIP